MTVEQGSVDAGFRRRFGVSVQVALVAGIVKRIGQCLGIQGSAVRVNVGLEDDGFAIGRKDDATGSRGKAGDLPGIAAIGGHGPYLRIAAFV